MTVGGGGPPLRLAVLDDYQRLALASADWDRLRRRGVEVTVHHEPLGAAAAAALSDVAVVVLMRERQPFPRELVERLPRLRLVVLTGARAPSLDLAACADHGVVVCHTGPGDGKAATAELTWALILAAARDLARAHAAVAGGGWHDGVTPGRVLTGRRLGVVGLGAIGTMVAGYGRAFGMDVVAWSPNLTDDRAARGGATRVGRDELLSTSDVVTLHMVLSDATRGMLGAAELALMGPGALLVNTSRGQLVDGDALVTALRAGRPGHAALDVFDEEPLPREHPLRDLPNVTLSPHLGYVTAATMAAFYRDAVECVEAWLDGAPVRVLSAPPA